MPRFFRSPLIWMTGAFCLLLVQPSAALQITRTSSPILYIDTGGVSAGQTELGSYASYQITNNDASAYNDLWVQLGSFTGSVISLAPNETGLVDLGPLAVGQTKTAYFYLMASAATATASTHQLCVYPSLALSSAIACVSFSLTSTSTNGSNSNKVTLTSFSPNPPAVGGILSINVQGTTGNLNANQVMSSTPA